MRDENLQSFILHPSSLYNLIMLAVQEFPNIQRFSQALPLDNIVRVDLQEGIPVLRASARMQKRIQHLLDRAQDGLITPDENNELDRYQEMDDYLSLVNRLVRNMNKTSIAHEN